MDPETTPNQPEATVGGHSTSLRSGRQPEFWAPTLGRLTQPCQSVGADEPVSAALRVLAAHPNAGGVVVLDGRRFLGWLDREAALDALEHQRLGDQLLPLGMTMLPSASIAAGLELAALREDRDMGSPLVIAERGTVLGVVPMRTLLSVAACSISTRRFGGDPASNPPGLVAAERHIGAKLKTVGSPAHATGELAAVFIDVRRFHEFNEAFGQEDGDRLIAALTKLISAALPCDPSSGSDTFFTPLGGDRFFLTTPAATLPERLAELTRRFDEELGGAREVGEFLPPDMAAEGHAPNSLSITLRVLVIPGAFTRIEHPRELFLLERQLRARDLALHKPEDASSTVIWEEREPRRPRARRAA